MVQQAFVMMKIIRFRRDRGRKRKRVSREPQPAVCQRAHLLYMNWFL